MRVRVRVRVAEQLLAHVGGAELEDRGEEAHGRVERLHLSRLLGRLGLVRVRLRLRGRLRGRGRGRVRVRVRLRLRLRLSVRADQLGQPLASAHGARDECGAHRVGIELLHGVVGRRCEAAHPARGRGRTPEQVVLVRVRVAVRVMVRVMVSARARG